jgi:Na+-transporting NADH:ubiquinone oxidoreductase subunit NqrD
LGQAAIAVTTAVAIAVVTTVAIAVVTAVAIAVVTAVAIAVTSVEERVAVGVLGKIGRLKSCDRFP